MIDKIVEAAGQGDAAGLLLKDDLGSGSSKPPGGAVNPSIILAPATATGGDMTSGSASLAGTTVQMGAAGGLVFNITYDSSVSNAPAGFTSAITDVVNYYESVFNDPITVNIDVGWGEVAGQSLGGALGASETNLGVFSYSQVKAALAADAARFEGDDIAPLATDSTYSSVMDPYVTILKAEAYAYHKEYVSKSPELYQAQTLKRIQAGADVTTSAYIQSRRQLEQIRRSVSRVFDDVDALVTPTAPVPPFAIADLEADPNTLREKELLMLRNTRPFNMLGLPTVSIPCGFTSADLPIGMQLTGPPGGEAMVLRLAYAYEQATEWHKRKPNLD